MSEKNLRRDQTPMTSVQACQVYLSDWKSGQSRPLEELLACVAPAERTQALRSLLIIEFRRRIQAGEKPTDKEYLRRFPDDLVVIGEVIEMFPAGPSSFLNQQPTSITGYGDEFDAAIEQLRQAGTDLLLPETIADVRSVLGTTAPMDEEVARVPKPLSRPDMSPNRLINLTMETYEGIQLQPLDAEKDLSAHSDEIHPNLFEPQATAAATAEQTPAGRRKPLIKLMLDWATGSSGMNAKGEYSPDALYQQITTKSAPLDQPIVLPKEPPKEVLSRDHSFREPVEAPVEVPVVVAPIEAPRNEGPILIAVVSAIVGVMILLLMSMLFTSRVKPMNEIEADSKITVPEKTVPATEPK